MGRRITWFTLCLLTLAALSMAPAAQERSALGPQSEKVNGLVGTWKVEGSLKAIEATGATDTGPVSYTQVGKVVNDGAIVQVQRTGTGPRGAVEELWLYSYNPVTKTYRMDATTGRSLIRNFALKINGNVWTFTGTNTTPAGVTTQERFTITYSDDMTSGTVKSEHSVDGKAWFERLTGTYTKVAAAAMTPAPTQPASGAPAPASAPAAQPATR